MGKQTTLAELATVHDQKLPLRVDVAEAKAATLPGPETAPTGSSSSCSIVDSWSKPIPANHPAGAALIGRICPPSGPGTPCETSPH